MTKATDVWDREISQTPEMQNMKQTNMEEFLKMRSKFISDSVYGPAINLD